MKPLPMSLSYLMIVLQLTIVQMLLVDYSDDIGRSVDDSVNSVELRQMHLMTSCVSTAHISHALLSQFLKLQTDNHLKV